MQTHTNDDWKAACNRIDVLERALERVFTGGNHVALLIGADHPPAGTSHDIVRKHYGAAHEQYEAWCCWNTIMAARVEFDRIAR